MVKTHPESRFALKTLDEIRDSKDVILQLEKTGSSFLESKKEIYLCEVVSSTMYNRSETAERLTDEIVRVNAENRRLQKK
ncbi:MAG: hypothetical protein K0Q87_4514, partial [Neobacillus sp.]|nr:hypothetical protein [Neobacillus sp.]